MKTSNGHIVVTPAKSSYGDGENACKREVQKFHLVQLIWRFC